MRLRVRELDHDAFSAFGRVIERPSRDRDAAGPGWQWWGENASMGTDGRPFGIGYLDLEPAPLRFDWAERHMRSVEVLVPVRASALVYVGPADHSEPPDGLPSKESFEVFLVPAGKGVLLDRGVWHGAPLALDEPCNVVVFLAEGTGRDDTTVVRWPDDPIEIER